MAETVCVKTFEGLFWAYGNNIDIRLMALTSDPTTPLHYERLRGRAFRYFKRNLDRSTRTRKAYVFGSYRTALGFDPETHRLHLHVLTIGGEFIPKSVLWTLAGKAGFGADVDIAGVPSPKARKLVRSSFAASGFTAAYRRSDARERALMELADVAAYLTHGRNNGLDLALAYAKTAAPYLHPFTSSGWPA